MVPRLQNIGKLSNRDTSALPATLLNNLPTCARECVDTAINDSFVPSQCKSTSNAGCLCSHYSKSGYTLGELSLSCLYANCPFSARNESSHAAFNICSDYSSAVVATHSVLTLTTQRPASSTVLSASPSSDVQTTQTTLSRTGRTSQFSEVATATITTSLAATQAPSEISAASSATSTERASSLTTGQAIGVSFASIGVSGLLVGVLFLCCCIRRRRKADSPTKKSTKSRHSFDFVDKSPPHSPVRMIKREPARPEEWWRNTGPCYPETNRASSDRKSHRNLTPNLRTLAHSTDSSGNARAEGSQRRSFKIPASGSNLNKPNRQQRPESSATGWTVFEEDCKSPLDKKTQPSLPVPPRPVFLPPINPSPGPSFADRYTTSPEDMHQPVLWLKIPNMKHDELPLPAELAPKNPAASEITRISMPPSSAVSYLPAYYTSSDSRTPVIPVWTPRKEYSRYSQPHCVPKPLTSKAVRSSFASDTTFESVNPDETTPENEDDKQLSPVSYPKVPRPSNQAIPRSPPQSFSPRPNKFSLIARKEPTLIAKRRGDDMAHDLEQGLRIKYSNGSFRTNEQPDSPLQGYDKGSKDLLFKEKSDIPEMDMKSPLWEPKLTPSRRGDDLYLQVELKQR